MTQVNQHPTGTLSLPPGPRGYPVLGVLPMMLRDPLHLFNETARRYGDVALLRAGSQHFYLFNHPDHYKHVLQEHYRNYEKGLSYRKLKLLLGEGLATSEGNFWLRQRRLAQPAFHHQRLALMATVMTKAATDMSERWQSIAARGETLDIAAEMMRLTQQIILTTMFSTSIGDNGDRVCQAFDTALKYLSNSLWLSALPERLNPGHRRFEQALHTLDSVIYRIINERRQSGEDRGDLLTMLLRAQDPENSDSMTDQQLRDEVLTIFSAGHETTATTLSWVWHMLAHHPEVEERLYTELAAVLGGRTPTFEDLPQLTYTRMVIDEVLRLYPPAWALFRTPIADDVIGGYDVPAGSVVLLCPYTMHRNQAYWDEPERFDPQRFTPERSDARPAYAYAPFGGGPRLCIGKSFAQMEAQLILATLAQRYRLRSVAKRAVAPTIAVVLRPQPGARMTLHMRSTAV